MIALGKRMLCVYGLKPDQSQSSPGGEMWSGGTHERFPGLRKKMTIRVRLFPRESQPCSSTRWLTISVKSRGLFSRKNKLCKVTERVGTKTFATTEAKYSVNDENVEIIGQLKDDSLGKCFLLRLNYLEDLEENVPAGVLYEGTLARSLDADEDVENWEITHDAMIFKEESSD